MKFTSLSKATLSAMALLSVLVGTAAANTCSQAVGQKMAIAAPAAQPASAKTIAEIVSQSGGEYDTNPEDFDILLNGLKQTGLVNVLADKKANLTAFVPTDAAFLKISRFFGYSGNDEAAVLGVLNRAFGKDFSLRDVLLYHVLPEAETLDALQKLPGDKITPTLLNGGNKPITASMLSYRNGNLVDLAPNLVAPKILTNFRDVAASNGVIHGIDRVLLPYFLSDQFPISSRTSSPAGQPMTIASVLAQSGTGYDRNRQDFDILNKLLQTAEMSDLFADPQADLTLFAPTDAAFVEFAKRQFPKGQVVFEGVDSIGLEARAYDYMVNILLTAYRTMTKTEGDFVDGDTVPLLQKALQYHVSPTAKTAKEIRTASSIRTLLRGFAITPKNGKRRNSSNLTNSQFQIGKTYARTTNGVIQSLDNVLVPSIEQLK
jgi:serralysin